MPMRALPALLAVAATVTAACLSVQSGLQRGGFFAERALWVAVGVVLVVAAHLLPALVRSHGWRVRTVGALLWIGCIAATCYGHAVFFLMAQKHAGELRAAAVPVVTVKGRGLAEIARDRADAVTRLARTSARRCVAPCPNLIADRTAAAARVEEFDTELAAARRAEAAQDRAAAERAAAMTDPVTGALTAYGVTAPRAELVTGLAFAGVLEAVSCFAWLLALRSADVTRAVTESPVTAAQQGSIAVTVAPVTPPSIEVAPVVTVTKASAQVAPGATEQMRQLPIVPQAGDVGRVAEAVAAGTLRATVTEIRKFLGCSQTKAAQIRKQLEPQT